VKKNQVAPVRGGLELFEIPKDGPPAIFIANEHVRHAARGERVPGGAIRHLCVVLRRVLGFRHLFAETDVIAIGEPLVRAMAGLPRLRRGYGVSTVRVTPRATTQPCVYWPGAGESLSDSILTGRDVLDSAPFEQARTLPIACQPCEFRDSCHGGCAGRRRLQRAQSRPFPHDSLSPRGIRDRHETVRARPSS
jgi:radical SAM protein with 4Fe4S-binding SPASM domain